jgi:uncharacterized protein YndB with AHSA1/START domain
MAHRIKLSQPVTASPKRLWAALTEPRHLKNWQADVADFGSEGGIQLGWPALGVETELRILEQNREERLVLATGHSRVIFELSAKKLTLEHSGLLGQDEVDGVRASWQVALGLLNHYLDHHFGHSRQVHWSIAPAQTSAATAHVFFTDARALDAWLTQGTTGIGSIGTRCQLKFAWGETLSGLVLAKTTDRDVAVSWTERENSALVFRTLPSPFKPTERILALCWSHWNCTSKDGNTHQGFEGALAALNKLLATRGSA